MKNNSGMMIDTKRLWVSPMSVEELQLLVDEYKDEVPELSQAYSEMLENCRRYPNESLWYTSWKLCRKEDNTVIGYAGFKGLDKKIGTEIGYGVETEFEGRGYAAEGVEALCTWAFSTDQITYIEAETDPDNIASQKVLQKNGFTATGKFGEEGPRFILTKADCKRQD